MRYSILRIAVGVCIAGALITGCNTPSQKIENAQNKVVDAEKDLETAVEVYRADMKDYRLEVAIQIADNNKKIAEFNTKISDEKAEAKADYKRKIAAIEKKNSDMQVKIDAYKNSGKDDWSKFKIEFKHDIDELGLAFKNLTINNK